MKLCEGDKSGTIFYSRDAGLAPEPTRVTEEQNWKDLATQDSIPEQQECISGASERD